MEEFMNRSQIRELAFKLLYQIEIQKEISDEDMELFFENNNITSEEAKSYIKDVVKGTSTNSQEILELISNNLIINLFKYPNKINTLYFIFVPHYSKQLLQLEQYHLICHFL